VTRILVIFGACAGLCYSALWYFPILILVGAIVTILWDTWLQQQIGKIQTRRARRRAGEDAGAVEANNVESVSLEDLTRPSPAAGLQRRTQATTSVELSAGERIDTATDSPASRSNESSQTGPIPTRTDTTTHGIPVKLGIGIIAAFLGPYHTPISKPLLTNPPQASFTIIMALRGTLKLRTLPFDLFANMYLAGTIIFGGGPVVIPLLREYVVQPGWVSPRDFLLGLAIIQALPGPNFNFGVYLGALTLVPTATPSIAGAFLGGLGIFAPGIVLSVGVQSLWRVLRTKPVVLSMLRGINATAVGLVFTAVYRLWEIGYLTPESSSGKSLAAEPWWVVVAAVTYAETAWFGVSPAAAIVMGAVLGLGWFGAVGR
jgi:chromate transport protein ChrA